MAYNADYAHVDAWVNPRGIEGPIVNLVQWWEFYRTNYAEEFDGAEIGNDGFLGEYWANIGMAILGLLNGPLGRLSGGRLDARIRNQLIDAGFDPDTL